MVSTPLPPTDRPCLAAPAPKQALLAQHPEAEEGVCRELASLGLLATPAAPRPRPVEHADLSQLPFLTACIKVGFLRYILKVAIGNYLH